MISSGKDDKRRKIERLTMLKSMYFRMQRASEFDKVLTEIVDDFDAGKMVGEHFEAGGMILIGESNSGKTREINEGLKRFAAQPPLECGLDRRFIQVALDGETTWKALGLRLAKELGHEMDSRHSEHAIWARNRQQLELLGIWLLHIDESQHIFETLGTNETKKVLNSIKMLMKGRSWPMVVILSKIPELLEKVNSDPQYPNLLFPMVMSPMDPSRNEDLDEIDTAFYGYAECLDVDISEVRTQNTYLRICRGHNNFYGRIFKFMVAVFAELPDETKVMTMEHLAAVYAQRTGCVAGHNVFIREDFENVETGTLLAGRERNL